VADGRTLGEAWRAIERVERRQDDHERDLREHYVRRDVYEANERARDAQDRTQNALIKQIQDDDTSKASGNRIWLLGLLQTAFGAALGLLGAYLMAKGHG
jgi:hypothetical protein